MSGVHFHMCASTGDCALYTLQYSSIQSIVISIFISNPGYSEAGVKAAVMLLILFKVLYSKIKIFLYFLCFFFNVLFV